MAVGCVKRSDYGVGGGEWVREEGVVSSLVTHNNT